LFASQGLAVRDWDKRRTDTLSIHAFSESLEAAENRP
jgi:hypothetical protein